MGTNKEYQKKNEEIVLELATLKQESEEFVKMTTPKIIKPQEDAYEII